MYFIERGGEKQLKGTDQSHVNKAKSRHFFSDEGLPVTESRRVKM
jgi:hypothetical protein